MAMPSGPTSVTRFGNEDMMNQNGKAIATDFQNFRCCRKATDFESFFADHRENVVQEENLQIHVVFFANRKSTDFIPFFTTRNP